MNKAKRIFLIGMMAAILLACGMFDFSRNEDGTFRVETNLTLEMIRAVIDNMDEMSSFVNLQMELRDGHIFMQADSVEYQGITARDVSFHVELGAENGKLSARITNVVVSGNELDDSFFESINQVLAQRLADSVQQDQRAQLESASVSPTGVLLVWRIDPSLGN
jgi:hypothetical protein